MRADAFLPPVLAKTLRDQRRALVGWGIAVALLALMQASFFPTIQEQAADLQKLVESYPPAMKAFLGDMSDFTTGAGYLRAELFTLMLPLLFLVYAIGRAADLVAGEEERGALDLLLAHPVTRRRALLEKAAGLALALVLLALVAWVPLALMDLALGMGVGPLRLALAVGMVVLLAWTFAALALAAGCLRGRKAVALAVAGGLAVATYLLHSLAALVPWMERAGALSPFRYYGGGEVLSEAADPLGVAVLLVLAGGLVALAAWAFERRDVGT